MKKILGLDLGANSIGWALVNEAQTASEASSIVKLGVRVIHFDNFTKSADGKESMDPLADFRGGKGISCNAGRTKNRGMRRRLQRYKLRRGNLIDLFKEHGFIKEESDLGESGPQTTFETYRLRAKAVEEEISLLDLARVLLMVNKKRGYKSNRKANSNDDGQFIDGMAVSRTLHEKNLTPGQYVLNELRNGRTYIPSFYSSELQDEFERIWDCQKQFYADTMDEKLRKSMQGKNSRQTWALCARAFNLSGMKRSLKGAELTKEDYGWRVAALTEKMDAEQLAVVLQNVNGQLTASEDYLGSIGNRSRDLYFSRQTVGQYLMRKLENDPNCSLKNLVFYRQDYYDEVEKIWEVQARFHKELTEELKKEIFERAIFYQRPLKSQKHLVGTCEFESRTVEKMVDGKKKLVTTGLKVCPKSSPLFQEFRIWQMLNNVQIIEKATDDRAFLTEDQRELLYDELKFRKKLSKTDALKAVLTNTRGMDLNYEALEGNRTQAALFDAYGRIIEMSGHGFHDFAKMNSRDVLEIVEKVFGMLGIDTRILHFDASLEGKEFEMQPAYKLWHMLYSSVGDDSKSGNEKLALKISEEFGMDKEYADVVASTTFEPDYGELSAKAIRKILPFLKNGSAYGGRKGRPDEPSACEKAGYRHSKNSLTKEEIANKVLKEHMELIPHHSLRNPVVEKILNQTVNVVNEIFDTFGKPDEIHIELARELKKSNKERASMTENIARTTAENERVRDIIRSEYHIERPSSNDVTRYKLWQELSTQGFKAMYSEKEISNPFDDRITIEHIIPKAKYFDDSYSNKTLEYKDVNIDKGNLTAYDFMTQHYGAARAEQYKAKVDKLLADKIISKSKHDNLLRRDADIPNDFINRDLRDSQYIASKARTMLEDVVRTVVSTSGTVTDRLRKDWQLVDVMQELNWDKYQRRGLTHTYLDPDGHEIKVIEGWTKRNDHRHHAIDALIIAFTKRNYIQYLNYLCARIPATEEERIYLEDYDLSQLEPNQRAKALATIESREIHRDRHNVPKFNLPMLNFRNEAKKQLEALLISTKTRSRVVTENTTARGNSRTTTLTPRGQLHNETVYGKMVTYKEKMEKVGATFDEQKIATVATRRYREALLCRLRAYDNDAERAFGRGNSMARNPIFIDEERTERMPETVKIRTPQIIYTIRKDVTPDLKIDKVIDSAIRELLQKRLDDCHGDAKAAFSDITNNPIWLNEEKHIAIKRVTIKGVNNVEALHVKHDNHGLPVKDGEGNLVPTDFVSTSNNHHVAIYMNAEGHLQEKVVSFYEAIARKNSGLDVIDKEYKRSEGWRFLFTMKQNEYFVFPNKETGFDPNAVDLTDPENYARISPNLYRVQKIASKNYFFRHHLETTVETPPELSGITYKSQLGLGGIAGIVKVRVNHIGQIVSVGEQ